MADFEDESQNGTEQPTPDHQQPTPDWGLRTIVHEDDAAAQRLSELGLDLPLLLEVVERGERARAESTANDPAIAPSLDAWRYRVRGLRDLFGERGWERDRPRGLEYLRSPCGRRGIITRAGNADVGLRNSHPQPLRGYGDATARAVETNGWLDPDWFNVESDNEPNSPDIETWMLLVHASGDLIRAELSQPGGRSDRGRVERWIERIILPSLDYTDGGGRRVPNEPEVEEIDVPVVRKQR